MGKDDEAYDEPQLLDRIRRGEVNAYAAIVRRFIGHVTRIVSRHVPRSQVEDVAQETFLRGFQGLRTFDGRKPFEHFLACIAVRCCCDFWRSRPNALETPVSALSDDAQEWMDRMTAGQGRAAHDEAAGQREAREVLHWAMAQIGAEDRMVLTLTGLEGYSTSEAASLLGMSVATVKIRAFRGRNRLHKILTRLDGGGA